ncbi:MAG: hypothetical protein AAF226_03060 [Verrucomicrobiota bacterium]
MHQFITAFTAICFLIGILGGIPFLFWVIFTALAKRWKKVGIQLGVAALLFGVVFGLNTWSNAQTKKSYVRGIFNTAASLGSPLKRVETDRAFNGDGYSFTVYELPLEVKERFANFDTALKETYPIRPEYRSGWQTSHWKQGPHPEIDDSLELKLAMPNYDGQTDGLKPDFEELKEILAGSEAFYSYFYKTQSDRPSNIDLFVIDLKGNRFFAINHNL